MIRKSLLAAGAAVALSLTVAACNPVAALNDGEAQITQFHDAFSRDDSDAIWALAGDDFRAATTREDLNDLLAFVDERLGAVRSSERTSFNVNTNNGVTVTTIEMDTQFVQGEGQETFEFVGTGEEMRLLSWNVNSNRLVQNAASANSDQGAAPQQAAPAPVAEEAPVMTTDNGKGEKPTGK